MIIDKIKLAAALKMVAPVVQSNPVIPALAGVKITEKYLTGGNQSVSVAVPVSLGIPETVLDFPILSKAASAISGEVDLTFKGEVAILKSSESGKVQVPVISAIQDYPEMKQSIEHNTFILTREDVAALNQLGQFTHNDGQPWFQGVICTGGVFAAYDKIALAVYHKEIGLKESAIFPKDLFKVLHNIPAAEYHFKNGVVTAKQNNEPVAFVKFLFHNENAPDITGLLNSLRPNKKAHLSQEEFSSAFDLLSISTDQANRTIELSIEPNNGITAITGREETNTLSEVTINSENEGINERFDIGFNIDSLAKGLKYLGGTAVEMEFNTETTAARVKSEEENRSLIIMPIALKVAA